MPNSLWTKSNAAFDELVRFLFRDRPVLSCYNDDKDFLFLVGGGGSKNEKRRVVLGNSFISTTA